LFICNKQDNPIGTVDLFDYEPLHHRAGIGIVISEPFRNKGFADDALKTLLTYCTDVLMLKQVYCNIGASNEESIKLFENNAFEKVGLKKAWNLVAQNKFEDEWLLQRINK
jgi:diamine N-acetyltransferase